MTRVLALVGALFLATPALAADLELPTLSPRAEVMQTVGVVEITVNYSSPGKRERTVWGEVVPYGTLWRTGANAATTFETTGDIKVGGKDVPAGTYSLLTIPGEESWTVILNGNPTASTGRYNEKEDVARIDVKAGKGAERERLTFLFDGTTDKATELQLVWDGVKVGIPVEVDTDAIVKANLESYVSDASGGLARAARHLGDTKDFDGALKLIDASLAIERTWYNVFLKADFLHNNGDHKQAKALAAEALELGNAAGDGFFWKERVEKANAEWPRK